VAGLQNPICVQEISGKNGLQMGKSAVRLIQICVAGVKPLLFWDLRKKLAITSNSDLKSLNT